MDIKGAKLILVKVLGTTLIGQIVKKISVTSQTDKHSEVKKVPEMF